MKAGNHGISRKVPSAAGNLLEDKLTLVQPLLKSGKGFLFYPGVEDLVNCSYDWWGRTFARDEVGPLGGEYKWGKQNLS
ncbi:hypothetical protein MOMUL_10160 [Moorella mulderi DSM 14980]|uniref:Uncharacterized protein n=1 Tax=Moorella mulderi DSM 14980 TaxID=1122241 RepID=A0A151B006_9FIRM|nr:hypothetical protein MOMUL_10160 [Moorella mulderi DSM 14980]